MTVELRPYQLDAIERTRDALRKGRRAPLLVAPTGAGKTVIIAEMTRLHLAANLENRVLVVAHRRELIGQICNSIIRLGVTDIGEILSGVRARSSARVQVASTQTLRARLNAPPASLVIVDECVTAVTVLGGKLACQIVVGDSVDSWDGSKVVSRKVVHCFKNKANSLMRIIAAGRSLVCTPSHPVFVQGKRYVFAGDLIVGQMVCVLRDGLSPITEIQTLSEAEFDAYAPGGVVYNFEVEGEHNYFANGILTHNCHHYSSDDWSQLMTSYSGVIRVGFTATPIRSDGRGMAPTFDSMIVVSSIRELTDLGRLTPCRVIAPAEPLEPPAMTHTPCEAYQAHAEGRVTVVFASTIAQAEEFATGFRDASIPVSIIHGDLSYDERARALRAHADGAVLINVMVCSEGWDSPHTSCCILARGCGSVGTYLQIVGRILRPHPGKKEALLIDLTGRAFWTHGPPDIDREYSLIGKGIREKSGIKESYCPVCGQLRERGNSICIVCAYVYTGGIVDIEYTGDELAERYALKRKEGNSDRISCLARWVAESNARGYKPGAATFKYQAVYNSFPSADVIHRANELAAMIPCSPCDTCKLASSQIVGGECSKCRKKKA